LAKKIRGGWCPDRWCEAWRPDSWAELKTADLRAMADRLRAAGFSKEVIRAVIAVQISENFKARREQLMPRRTTSRFGRRTDRWRVRSEVALRAPGSRREQSKLLKDVLGADATSQRPDDERVHAPALWQSVEGEDRPGAANRPGLQ